MYVLVQINKAKLGMYMYKIMVGASQRDRRRCEGVHSLVNSTHLIKPRGPFLAAPLGYIASLFLQQPSLKHRHINNRKQSIHHITAKNTAVAIAVVQQRS
jgi:hypothetical protein